MIVSFVAVYSRHNLPLSASDSVSLPPALHSVRGATPIRAQESSIALDTVE